MKNKDEIIERRNELRRKILTLEWDKTHKQIHSGQNKKLEEYKEELVKIEQELGPEIKEPEPIPSES